MTVSADWERVNQLFQEALALAPDARAAFVETPAGDAHVLQELMSLLHTQSAAEGFLSKPPDSAQVSVETGGGAIEKVNRELP